MISEACLLLERRSAVLLNIILRSARVFCSAQFKINTSLSVYSAKLKQKVGLCVCIFEKLTEQKIKVELKGCSGA